MYLKMVTHQNFIVAYKTSFLQSFYENSSIWLDRNELDIYGLSERT